MKSLLLSLSILFEDVNISVILPKILIEPSQNTKNSQHKKGIIFILIHVLIPRSKDSLLKVLVAISNTVKEVGYIQGLNSIAGVFLFYLKEEESFWIMLYLMERLKTKNIFQSDFEQVSLLNYQLEAYIGYYLPALSEYFVIICS